MLENRGNLDFYALSALETRDGHQFEMIEAHDGTKGCAGLVS